MDLHSIMMVSVVLILIGAGIIITNPVPGYILAGMFLIGLGIVLPLTEMKGPILIKKRSRKKRK